MTEIEIRIDELERAKEYIQNYLLETTNEEFPVYEISQSFDDRINDLKTFGIDVKSRIW